MREEHTIGRAGVGVLTELSATSLSLRAEEESERALCFVVAASFAIASANLQTSFK